MKANLTIEMAFKALTKLNEKRNHYTDQKNCDKDLTIVGGGVDVLM